MTGKFSPDSLDQYVFTRTGAPNDDLLQGPAYGGDAAAIAVDGQTMVISTDPISLAAERIGTLGVAIASNDVAVSGGLPKWMTVTVLLPEENLDLLDRITAQLDREAERLGITIVGGHTESVAALSRPLLSLTCMGPAERFVPTGGAQPGDRVVLTKGAAIEGTAVLATDFRDDLDLPAEVLDAAAGFFDDISVIPDASVLAPVATSMHDPTEGGVFTGLIELAASSGVRLDVDRDAIPYREETRRVCDAMGVDPLRILGSGAVLATVPESDVDDVLDALAGEGIDAGVVGTVEESAEPGVSLGGELYTEPAPDEIYALWE